MSKRKTKTFPTVGAVVGVGTLAYFLYKKHADRQARADSILHAAAQSMLASIAQVMGCAVPPLVISRSVPNAQADAFGVICINPDWLRDQMASICSDLRCHYDLTLGVLAHEMSHIVHGDARALPHQKEFIELRADHFAGVALARLGVSPEAFADVIWQIAQHHSSGPFGYPSRLDRVNAIQGGYENEQQWLLAASYEAGRLAALRYLGLAA